MALPSRSFRTLQGRLPGYAIVCLPPAPARDAEKFPGGYWLKTDAFICNRVARYYWRDDINCATTTLKILAEHFDLPLSDQVIDAAVGMHGAGEYGAQCGLVEGTLMYLGIVGRSRAIPDNDIISACRVYAENFEKRFKSLACATLRPAGFDPRNPPHLCEDLTGRAIVFSVDFIQKFLDAGGTRPASKTAPQPLEGDSHQHSVVS